MPKDRQLCFTLEQRRVSLLHHPQVAMGRNVGKSFSLAERMTFPTVSATLSRDCQFLIFLRARKKARAFRKLCNIFQAATF